MITRYKKNKIILNPQEIVIYLEYRYKKNKNLVEYMDLEEDLEFQYQIQGLESLGINFEEYKEILESAVVGRFI